MTYSKTHCHFCGEKLDKSPWDPGELRCFRHSHPTYRYFQLVDMVAVSIGHFDFKFWNHDEETVITETHLTGVVGEYKLPAHVSVNTDNYLEVVDKAKKLQIFR